MPRFSRKTSQTQVYHIMMRGNNKEKIFIDEEDKSTIIKIVEDKKKSEEYFLYAYCVMDNHIHLIIKEGKDQIARIVKRVAASYSFYFNKKYKRIGHIFQERFRSEIIENERYLLSAIRYIHQNPVKPGIGTIDGYKWSSYSDYMRKGKTITNCDDILSIFSNSQEKALAEFARFNCELTEEAFLDMIEEKELDQNSVIDFINSYLAGKGLEIYDLKSSFNKGIRDELIGLLLDKSNISLRGLALALGLNREVVRKSQCQ